MRNLFLMSLFAMFMTVAWGGQSIFNVSIATSAYADDNKDNGDDEESHDKDSNNNEVAFSCPSGLTSCYRADGSEYIDVNALEATAAGYNEDDEDKNKDNAIQVVNPKYFRSF